jgi:hypothetical protein
VGIYESVGCGSGLGVGVAIEYKRLSEGVGDAIISGLEEAIGGDGVRSRASELS